MIKKCMTTGLLYLCKTSSPRVDPYKYKGSGKLWVNHIRKHNSYIVTCVLGEYKNKDSLRVAGLYYSNLFDVVDSPMWANLTVESGDGGDTGKNSDPNKIFKQRISLMNNWKKRTDENKRLAIDKMLVTRQKNNSKVGYAVHPISGKEACGWKGYWIIKGKRFETLASASKYSGLNPSTIIDLCIKQVDVISKYDSKVKRKGKTPRELGYYKEEL